MYIHLFLINQYNNIKAKLPDSADIDDGISNDKTLTMKKKNFLALEQSNIIKLDYISMIMISITKLSLRHRAITCNCYHSFNSRCYNENKER